MNLEYHDLVQYCRGFYIVETFTWASRMNALVLFEARWRQLIQLNRVMSGIMFCCTSQPAFRLVPRYATDVVHLARLNDTRIGESASTAISVGTGGRH